MFDRGEELLMLAFIAPHRDNTGDWVSICSLTVLGQTHTGCAQATGTARLCGPDLTMGSDTTRGYYMINTAEVIIWSADVDEATLDEVLVDGCPLQYVKLDRLGLTKMQLRKIRDVQERGFSVFADAKIAEIPDKVLEVAKLHLEYRPWMLNCMANISSSGIIKHEDVKKIDGLKRFADLCLAAGTKPCAVTVLTSKTEAMVEREYNGRTPIDQVLVYVEMLLDAGFTDVVCSPLEVPAIRAEARFNKLDLNTPGIRLPESDVRDQARVNTPAAAKAAGATRLVIGSDLTNGDFAENFRRIDANLNP
jgi:orotidine-5'-phosphate decarboxylase